jgi:Flp pilus assembly pilin Flp
VSASQFVPVEPSRFSLPPTLRSSSSIFSTEKFQEVGHMIGTLRSAWEADDGQDIAEYAVMLAVILVIVVGSIRLIGSNANNVFSAVSSSLQ